MKFYHYSSTDRLHRIAWDYHENGTEAFKPRRRFIPFGAAPSDLPRKKHDPAIFGLLDPMDIKWCTATYLEKEPLLETVLGDINDKQLSLLEIAVTSTDDIYVADHSPHLRSDYDGARGAKTKITYQVKRAYWESLMPLADYLTKNQSYAVPEIICFTPIPLEQIRLVETTEKDIVINRVRAKGGFPQHPLRPRPDQKVQDRIFREMFMFDKPGA